MSTNGKTLKFRAAKLKGFTVLELLKGEDGWGEGRLWMDGTMWTWLRTITL